MAKKNTDGMIKRRQEDSAAKKSDISSSIDKLVKDKKTVNVSSVARQAKCSKNTVRKHDDIMERIEELREIQQKKKSCPVESKKGKNRDERMIELYNRNKELEQKIDKVTEQLLDQTELEIKIKKFKDDNTRLIKNKNELVAINGELVKQLEALTKILDKRRDPGTVLNLVTLSKKEDAATKTEDASHED